MGAIDIGTAAINRTGAAQDEYTEIVTANPANDSGAITSVEIWANANMINTEVAIFRKVSGTSFTTRDNETLGTVSSGSKQVFSGLDMDVVAGDYLGAYWTLGSLETSAFGEGLWEKKSDEIPCTNSVFSVWANRTCSLYGTGEASVAAPTVTTQAVSSIATTTATGNGNITDDGGETPSAWGVCVDTSAAPDTGDTVFSGSGAGAEGAFTASMTGLTAGTKYYVRAYATNTEGTSYGAQVDFGTKQEITSVLMTADAAMLVPAMSLGINITSALMEADGAMLVPAMSLGINITSALMEADGAMLVPTLVRDSIITSAIMEANAALLVPTLVRDNIFDVALMEATGEMLVPVVGVATNVNVTAVLMEAAAAMLIPTLVRDRIITVVPMEANGAMPVPSLSLGMNITAVPMIATSEMLIPTLVRDCIFTATQMTGTAAMPVPSLSLGTTVAAVLMEATAAMLVPTLIRDRIFTAALMTANAAMLAPAVGIGVTITVVPMTANAVMLIPVISIEGLRFYGHAYTIRYIEGVGYTVRHIEGVAYTGG